MLIRRAQTDGFGPAPEAEVAVPLGGKRFPIEETVGGITCGALGKDDKLTLLGGQAGS